MSADVTPVLAQALRNVLADHKAGKLTATATAVAIAMGMDDTHDLLTPDLTDWPEPAAQIIRQHINAIQEARRWTPTR